MNRRKFIQNSLIGGVASTVLPGHSLPATSVYHVQSDPIIPNLKKKITSPVTIQSVELLKVEKNHFIVTTSADGATGVSKANSRMENMITMFKNQIAPCFEGQDAREIERLVEEVYTFRRNYKYAGMSLWNCVAHVEVSILDMLGRVAGLPVNKLIGKVIRNEVPVYMSSTERGTTAEEEVAWVDEVIRETKAKAAKLKIGGRMSKNKDAYPGRSEDLIKLARQKWGDDFVLYFDSNGSYDVPKAIEMGKLLQDYGVAFYEEPVPWEDFFGTKQVNDALEITVAGGEQDHSLPKWEWMINNRALDLVQPDIMYNGGMIRTIKVAQLAEKAGIKITLHSPKNDALASYMLHFASITGNLGEFQEFRAKPPGDETYYTPKLRVKNGKINVPDGVGFGIEFDPDYLKKGKVI